MGEVRACLPPQDGRWPVGEGGGSKGELPGWRGRYVVCSHQHSVWQTGA
jgi:hypothetical protein